MKITELLAEAEDFNSYDYSVVLNEYLEWVSQKESFDSVDRKARRRSVSEIQRDSKIMRALVPQLTRALKQAQEVLEKIAEFDADEGCCSDRIADDGAGCESPGIAKDYLDKEL